MGDALVSRYWCYMCSQIVNPNMEIEIKCPFCESGFVEEMDGRREDDNNDLASERTLSLWAPILLGMLGSPPRPRFRREEVEEEEQRRGESQQEWDSEAFLQRRRRRSSAAILQLLQGLHAVTSASESENSNRERDRERLFRTNPFNQAVILQGSSVSDQTSNESHNHSIYSSLGDYFIGPGLDLLLQHLSENDSSRNGTPPAQKEAVEAMPSVKIAENLQCWVCLEDFDVGSEAKEMPCKHKFHSGCILPWLELHSSCPVCRFQMPAAADESKDISNGSGNNSSSNRGERDGEEGNGNGRRFRLPVPWPFSGLFSMSGSGSGGNSSSTSPS